MQKIKERFNSHRVFIIIFLCACLFSVIHILPPFNMDIINYDSAYQYCLTQQSPSEIVRLIPEDYSPPLYTILLKLWTFIFGQSLEAMRGMSLLVIFGMLFLAAFPIREAFDGKVSFLCTVFFLFTSLNYKLMPEIRPTFFAYFFVTAAGVYSYLRAVVCGGVLYFGFGAVAFTERIFKNEKILCKRHCQRGMLSSLACGRIKAVWKCAKKLLVKCRNKLFPYLFQNLFI